MVRYLRLRVRSAGESAANRSINSGVNAMDIRQLRSFVRIVELGSINRASKKLHVAQPALSLQMRKLEEELEVELLMRHARGVEATEAGQILLLHARRILEEAERARHALRALRGAPGGRVAMGVTPSINSAMGAELVTRCRANLPNVVLPIHEEMSEILIDGVRSGRLEIGLAYPAAEVEGLTAEPLVQERLFFVQRPPGRRQGQTISFREVASAPLALPTSPYNLRGLVEATANRYRLDLTIHYEAGSTSLIKEFVARGEAASILPWNSISREVAAGALAATEICEPAITRTLYLVYSDNRPVSRAASALRSVILDVVAQAASRDGSPWTRTSFLESRMQ
jgi:LysR family nitrogen assimilation transcriptional regulator